MASFCSTVRSAFVFLVKFCFGYHEIWSKHTYHPGGYLVILNTTTKLSSNLNNKKIYCSGSQSEGQFTWRKFVHQMKHFCCGLAFLLHDSGVLAPLKPQMFGCRV